MSFFQRETGERSLPAPVSRWFRLLSGCGEQRFHIPEERFGFRNVLAAQRDDFVRSFGKLFSGRSVGRNESQWPFFFELDGVAHQERIPVRSRQQGDQPVACGVGDRGDRRGAVVAHLIEREDQLVGDDLRPVDDRNGLPVFGFIFPEFVFRKITVFVEPDRGVSFLRSPR